MSMPLHHLPLLLQDPTMIPDKRLMLGVHTQVSPALDVVCMFCAPFIERLKLQLER